MGPFPSAAMTDVTDCYVGCFGGGMVGLVPCRCQWFFCCSRSEKRDVFFYQKDGEIGVRSSLSHRNEGVLLGSPLF